MRRLSRIDRNGNTSRPSGTWLMPSRTTASGSMPSMRRPSNSIEPFCGAITPEMVFKMVVLPAPLAPSTVTICPAIRSRLIPRIAVIGP